MRLCAVGVACRRDLPDMEHLSGAGAPVQDTEGRPWQFPRNSGTIGWRGRSGRATLTLEVGYAIPDQLDGNSEN